MSTFKGLSIGLNLTVSHLGITTQLKVLSLRVSRV